jgi:hypothetical protein
LRLTSDPTVIKTLSIDSILSDRSLSIRTLSA